MNALEILTAAPQHQAIVALVVGALTLLVLAPRIDQRPLVTTSIGLAAVAVAVALCWDAAPAARLAVLGAGAACAVGLVLLGQLHERELHDPKQQPEVGALLLIGTIGAIVLVTAQNLLELALGVETISVTASVLVGMGAGSRPLEAAFKYFVLTAVTFATLLFGVALIFLGTGSLALPELALIEGGARWLVLGGSTFVVVGLAFKLALVPVHFGALDAYTAGPPSLVGFIMVASKLGAVVALVRVAHGMGTSLDQLLLLIGLGTIAWGVLGSFAQTDLRRLLAYSAVAHAGFLALGAAGGAPGGEAAVFYVVGYGASALLCFACLAGQGTGKVSLRGLGPARGLGLLVGLLSLAGVPPLPGFWVKLAVLQATWARFGVWPTALAALGGVVGAIYYLRPLPELFGEARRKEWGGPGAVVGVVVAAALLFVLTFAPALGSTLAKL